MTVFDDREKAFEAKFHLDQEMEFRATARRDKLLGLWAAEKMGLGTEEAAAYARTVVEVECGAGDHDAGHKLARDFASAGIVISEAEIRHRMAVLMVLAREQIVEEQRK